MNLNKDSVFAIRFLYAAGGCTIKQLARQFNVTTGAAWSCIQNRTHVDLSYEKPYKPPFNIRLAQELRRRGYSYERISLMECQSAGRVRPYCAESVRTKLKEAANEQQQAA